MPRAKSSPSARSSKSRVAAAAYAAGMNGPTFALFDTSIGRCGLAWNERGIVAVQLPEAREMETRARLLRRFPTAREGVPTRQVRHVLDDIGTLLRGAPTNLS